MMPMFAERRERFMEAMDGAVAVFFAAPPRTRSNDTEYRYRQDSTFHYLTGFGEPGAVAVLRPGHPEHPYVLFVRPRNRERETWEGRRAGPDGAKARFAADAAFPIEELEARLPDLLKDTERVYYAMGEDPERDAMILGAVRQLKAKVRQGVKAPAAFLDPAALINEMRLFKSPQELDRMRRAAAISSQAHRDAMYALAPGMHEYEIEAILEYGFRRNGASGPAYNTIVGSGVNATILHYVENSDVCRAGDLLLVDAGAEFEGYSADITRTYPVSGRFTPIQKEVYGIVLAAQLAAIERVRSGVAFDAVHAAALEVLVEGLVRLAVLSGEPGELIEKEAYKPYYMHQTSHWLGLDVHDVGSYRTGQAWRTLEPGMVLTVEPGLYFGEDQEEVPPALRGMGVRIEDDVLVTTGAPDVLTAATPKTPDEVEAVMARPPVNTATPAGERQ
jgi:Xaa-Pro aminopeptidase